MADPTEPIIHTCHACGTLIDVSEQEPLALVHCPTCGAGQRVRTNFDHFQLQEVLGAGGMGAVYRAFDANLSRFVALKLLRREYSANPEFVTQFEREAAITASINHPHVVKVYSAGEDQGLVYIAMELVDKGSLDDLMGLQGRVAEPQVLEVGKQAAMGLNAALARGLIHRDVKPGNILFADAHTAKIVDFGLASLQEQASKGPGEVWGTPYYVAPEKLENPPVEDFRSDMYSLGATLFHALAGRPPFEAETASMVALKHLKSQAVSLQAFAPDVSSETAFVINKTLSKDPEKRYQSYHELIEHLDYARNEVLKKAGSASQKRARVVIEDEDEERAMSWITFAMIAVVVLGGVGVWVMRDRLFGSGQSKVDPIVERQKQLAAELEPQYNQAREKLINKQFLEAAEAFYKISSQPDVPRPLLDWTDLHQGLALLFAGKETESRRAFSRLAARDLHGKDTSDKKLSQFFIDTGRAMETGEAKPASAARDLEKSNHEAIGLLLFALKDWQLGKVEDGGSLFRQFQSATPEPPVHWIADYKPLITPYVDDFTAFRTATEEVKAATTAEKRRSAIGKVKSAREQLKLGGVIATKLEQMTKQLEKDLAGDEVEMKKRAAESESADQPKFDELRKKVAPLLATFKYAEAKAQILGLKPGSEKYQAYRQALLDRVEALNGFKTQLIRDLAPGTYAGQIKKAPNALLPPGKVTATEAGLDVKNPFGIMQASWAEVAPETVIAMAKSFIKPELPADAAADRNWGLGLYALSIGQKAMAKELLTAAAEAKPQYKDQLAKISEIEGL
jgi:serine/threonine protein kinase